uniref:PAX transactivation activation domain-interacting protein n=1 Tax=Steinernema glaseri TaxID=37863 RepID=A0A1I7ZI54_9BILA
MATPASQVVAPVAAAMPQGQPGVRPQMGGKGQQQQAMYPAQYMGGARQGAPMMLEPLTTQRLAQANPQVRNRSSSSENASTPLIQRFCDEIDVPRRP